MKVRSSDFESKVKHGHLQQMLRMEEHPEGTWGILRKRRCLLITAVASVRSLFVYLEFPFSYKSKLYENRSLLSLLLLLFCLSRFGNLRGTNKVAQWTIFIDRIVTELTRLDMHMEVWDSLFICILCMYSFTKTCCINLHLHKRLIWTRYIIAVWKMSMLIQGDPGWLGLFDWTYQSVTRITFFSSLLRNYTVQKKASAR